MQDREAPKKRRRLRWFQYSLRTYMLVVLAVSLGASWFAVRLKQAKHERQIVQAITEERGYVRYPENKRTPQWLLTLLGKEFFTNRLTVVAASDEAMRLATELRDVEYLLVHLYVTDTGMACLKDLPELEGLDIYSNRVTNVGIAHIAGMPRLTYLSIGVARITDLETTRHLRSLPRLRWLKVISNQLTDARMCDIGALPQLEVFEYYHASPYLGDHLAESPLLTDTCLVYFARTPRLTTLKLRGTAITGEGINVLADCTTLSSLAFPHSQFSDEGLKDLRSLVNLTHLDLSNTQVTDEGLKDLGAMANLASLDLSSTQVGESGLENLVSLSSLDLSRTKLKASGIPGLSRLTNLQYLDLWDIELRPEAATQLRDGLPECKVGEFWLNQPAPFPARFEDPLAP